MKRSTRLHLWQAAIWCGAAVLLAILMHSCEVGR